MPPSEAGDGAIWEGDVVLADGATVHVRPIHPSDAPLIEDLHHRLSPETIYRRFFTPKPELDPELLTHLVTVDYVDRMALVALLGGRIIAVARYDRMAGSTDAEVAFVVDDAHQGRGLGTLLLEHLVVIARTRGITRFIAETLPENQAMLHVFLGAGFGSPAASTAASSTWRSRSRRLLRRSAPRTIVTVPRSRARWRVSCGRAPSPSSARAGSRARSATSWSATCWRRGSRVRSCRSILAPPTSPGSTRSDP
jgi:GNAT superfamily N-acetyltransferase